MYVSIVRGDVVQETQGAFIASGAGGGVLLGPIALLGRAAKSFTVVNYGPATLSGVKVQINPDTGGYGMNTGMPPPASMAPSDQQRRGPDPALWHDYDTATFNSMASGVVRTLTLDAVHRWYRLLAINDRSSVIPASGWCYASTL